MAQLIVNDQPRNQLIVNDVIKVLLAGAKCLILTERVEHCETILNMVRENVKGIHATIATGRMTKNSRQKLIKRIRQDQFQLLIATGKLIGEGFDWPELTYLFLAFPFSWKGKLVQYIGRVQRSTEGKTEAYVYDYLDYAVPMLKVMYFRRLRTYRSLKNLVKYKMPTKVSTKASQVADNQMSLF